VNLISVTGYFINYGPTTGISYDFFSSSTVIGSC